ncbi:MAG: two-component regulator propeller domain-containing protein, partial [Cyclobacteriaceae bacterium]
MAISQDKDGFMWFGTRDGLNQFDGKKFKIFRSKNKDSTTISNNDILDLEVDEKGDLWVGTTNGLNRYDKELKIFQRYYKTTNDSLSLVSNTIREILVSGKDVWIGTSNGLCVLDQSTGIFHNFSDQPGFILNNQIMELSKDDLGNIWIGTNTGLVRVTDYNKGKLQFIELADFKNVSIQSITKRENKLFVGTKKYGIKVLELATNKMIDEIMAPELANDDIRAMEVDNDGNLWVGSYNGLNIINNKGQISHLTNDANNLNSISRNTIKSIFLDQQGSIWVGTYYGGINYWNDLNFNFKYIEKIPSGAGLSYSVVSAMESYQGDLYIATEGGGITIKKQDKTYEYINTNNSKLPSNNVKALFRDKEKLLIGTFNAGLVFFDLKNNSVTKTFNTDNSLPHNSVYGLAKSNNYYWIGTFGGGLVRYDSHHQKTDIFQKTSNQTSLSDDQVRVVFSDKLNGLWVGTQNGLNYASNTNLDSDEILFQKYLYNEVNQSGEDVLCVFQDSFDVIWVGTKENGLYRKNNNRFELIELFEDLPNASNTVHAIEEGENGDLWISSNNGILKYNPTSGEQQLFEKSDGLIPNEFNSNSSFKDNQNTLYFGGPMGVSYFSPSQLKRNTYAPKVVLTDFYLADEEVTPLDNTGILDRAIAYTETIKLDYDQTTFSLRFAMPNYVNSEKNNYSYRLKGLSEWTYTTSNTASYTIQEAGAYVFEVKGQNNDEKWSEEITSLTIKIKPAPWRTPWAFGGYAIAILGAIYFLTRTIQIRGQLERDLMLEHESNEREKVLNQMKLQFFTNISHEFRTPLTLIVGPLQKIIQDYRGSSKLYKQILIVEKNAHQLFKLINQLMDFRKLENNESKLVSAQGNIVKFTEEVFISFQNHAKNIGYNFTFSSVSEDIQVYYDRDKMERILFNLISNSFKFTPRNGDINISIEENEEQVLITVADTGIGIAAEAIPRIFDRFY